MSEQGKFWAAVALAVLVKLLTSETLSLWRAAATVAAAVLSAGVFTDPVIAWFDLDGERYRVAIAALLALTGENVIRVIVKPGFARRLLDKAMK